MNDVCRLRPLERTDLPYLLECWIQTERRYSRASIAHIKALAAAQLDKHGARVACVPDDADAILGFAVVDRTTNRTLMAYVRKAARGLGICKQLFQKG